MRIRCWARAISSRCTVLTSSSCSLGQVAQRGAHGHELLLAAAARPARPRYAPRRGGHGDLQPLEHRRYARPTASATRPSRAAARAGRRPWPGRRARPARPAAASRPGRTARGPAPPRCAARAGRPSRSGGRRLAASASRSRSVVSGSSSGRPRRRRAAAARGRRGRRGPCRGRLGGGDGPSRAAPPRPWRSGPASRTGRAPRRPRRAWRRTRAAWRAPRRPAAGPAARSSSRRDRSKASRSQEWVASASAVGRPRRRPPAPRSGWAARGAARRRSGRRGGRRRG